MTSEKVKFSGWHAVRVIGWGKEKGKDFWLCANSWGSDWGENGFFKIRRGTNEASCEEHGFFGVKWECATGEGVNEFGRCAPMSELEEVDGPAFSTEKPKTDAVTESSTTEKPGKPGKPEKPEKPEKCEKGEKRDENGECVPKSTKPPKTEKPPKTTVPTPTVPTTQSTPNSETTQSSAVLTTPMVCNSESQPEGHYWNTEANTCISCLMEFSNEYSDLKTYLEKMLDYASITSVADSTALRLEFNYQSSYENSDYGALGDEWKSILIKLTPDTVRNDRFLSVQVGDKIVYDIALKYFFHIPLQNGIEPSLFDPLFWLLRNQVDYELHSDNIWTNTMEREVENVMFGLDDVNCRDNFTPPPVTTTIEPTMCPSGFSGPGCEEYSCRESKWGKSYSAFRKN